MTPEGQRVGDIGEHRRPAGPPGPTLALTEREGHDGEEEEAEDQLVDRVADFQEGDVPCGTEGGAPCLIPRQARDGGEGAGVIGGQADPGIGAEIGQGGQEIERPEEQEEYPHDGQRARRQHRSSR